MKAILFAIIAIISFSAYGNDPFDRSQREGNEEIAEEAEETELSSKNDEQYHESDDFHCAENNRQAENLRFIGFKLVGVVIGKEDAFALLTDDAGQMYQLHEKEYFAQESYQVEKIQKDRIMLQRKKGDQCKEIETKEIKF